MPIVWADDSDVDGGDVNVSSDAERSIDAELYAEGVAWLVASVSFGGGACLGALLGKEAFGHG